MQVYYGISLVIIVAAIGVAFAISTIYGVICKNVDMLRERELNRRTKYMSKCLSDLTNGVMACISLYKDYENKNETKSKNEIEEFLRSLKSEIQE